MCSNKKQLREKFFKLRSSVTFSYEKNCQIAEKVLKLLESVKYDSVFSYVSMACEVDTKRIISALFPYVKVLVPYTYDGVMTPVLLDDLSRLEKVDRLGNVFGKNEKPATLSPTTAPTVTIIPMLAFSVDLYRLGYGGGYYDRYLSQNDTLKIGLAFDEQQTFEKFNEVHDVKLDIIVTPTRVLRRE